MEEHKKLQKEESQRLCIQYNILNEHGIMYGVDRYRIPFWRLHSIDLEYDAQDCVNQSKFFILPPKDTNC